MATGIRLVEQGNEGLDVQSGTDALINLSSQEGALRFQGEVIEGGTAKDTLLREAIPGFLSDQCEFIHLELRNSLTGQTSVISGQLESLPTGDLLFMERDHFSGASLPVSENHIEIDTIRVMDDVNLRDVVGPRGKTSSEGSRRMHVSCYERPLEIRDPYRLPESLLESPVQLTYIHDGDTDHPGNYLTVSGTLESVDDKTGTIRLKAFAGRERDNGEFKLEEEYHKIVKVEAAILGATYNASTFGVSATGEGSKHIAAYLRGHYGKGAELRLTTTEGATLDGTLQEFTRGHENQPVLVLSNDQGLHAYYMDEIQSLAPQALLRIQEDRYQGVATGANAFYSLR